MVRIGSDFLKRCDVLIGVAVEGRLVSERLGVRHVLQGCCSCLSSTCEHLRWQSGRGKSLPQGWLSAVRATSSARSRPDAIFPCKFRTSPWMEGSSPGLRLAEAYPDRSASSFEILVTSS